MSLKTFILGHCKKLKPIWEELADEFKDKKDFLMAMVDGTANDFEEFELGMFPTLQFYKKDTNEMQNYDGKN